MYIAIYSVIMHRQLLNTINNMLITPTSISDLVFLYFYSLRISQRKKHRSPLRILADPGTSATASVTARTKSK